MKPVLRSEIVDYQTYEDLRPEIREKVMKENQDRRIHLGPHLTFLFETHATVRYQVQEMMRAEQIVREKDIQHELDTYNELLGGAGELGCTLLIEIDDPLARADKLARWPDLPKHLYAKLEDGKTVRPSFDERQVGEGRLSSVQYLKFRVGSGAPVALGCDHTDAEVRSEVPLTEVQRAALQADLDS
jgi:Protein of unknown function (DUF3501)